MSEREREVLQFVARGHTHKEVGEELGLMHAVNMAPIVFDRSNPRAALALVMYKKIMEESPHRGPLVMATAMHSINFAPCLLPPQWCVCREHVGIGNEIILHVGHPEVRKHYGV